LAKGRKFTSRVFLREAIAISLYVDSALYVPTLERQIDFA